MAGLTKEHVRIIDYVTPQGVTTLRTTKGILFRMPNGETEMLHYTVSDWRGTRNFRANLRRNGIEYPGDYENKKSKKPPKKDSIEKVKSVLSDFNSDSVTTVEIYKKLKTIGTPANATTIQGVMLYLGYWHDYKKPDARTTFVWHPPIDPKEIVEPLEDMENLVEYADDTDDETDADTETVNVSTVAVTENALHNDGVEHWFVQLDGLDGSITIDQLRIIYMAAGFNLEVRLTR